MFSDLKTTRLRAAFKAYESLTARSALAERCRAAVSEWKWARGEMWRPEPFRGLPGHVSDGQWLSASQRRGKDDLRHGLDSEGRVHVAECWSFDGKLTKTSQAETYFVFEDDVLETVRYRYPGRNDVELLHRFKFQGDRLERRIALSPTFGSEARFVWKKDRLVAVQTAAWKHVYDCSEQKWSRHRLTSLTVRSYEYDKVGKLTSVLERSVEKDGTPVEGISPRKIFPA